MSTEPLNPNMRIRIQTEIQATGAGFLIMILMKLIIILPPCSLNSAIVGKVRGPNNGPHKGTLVTVLVPQIKLNAVKSIYKRFAFSIYSQQNIKPADKNTTVQTVTSMRAGRMKPARWRYCSNRLIPH